MTFQDNQRIERILMWLEHNCSDIVFQIKSQEPCSNICNQDDLRKFRVCDPGVQRECRRRKNTGDYAAKQVAWGRDRERPSPCLLTNQISLSSQLGLKTDYKEK